MSLSVAANDVGNLPISDEGQQIVIKGIWVSDPEIFVTTTMSVIFAEDRQVTSRRGQESPPRWIRFDMFCYSRQPHRTAPKAPFRSRSPQASHRSSGDGEVAPLAKTSAIGRPQRTAPQGPSGGQRQDAGEQRRHSNMPQRRRQRRGGWDQRRKNTMRRGGAAPRP